MSPAFVPGLELSRQFYRQAVQPLLDRHFPGLPHCAARIGSGSEVLGYDTPRSADHEWGPRLHLFLDDDDAERHGSRIVALLSEELPKSILGYPTNFAAGGVDPRIRHMQMTDGPVHHRVGVSNFASWSSVHFGFDPRSSPTLLDWLATPWQRFLEFTGGAVFRDDIGDVTSARATLAWYPADVDAYLLACQWAKIAQQEAFPGRSAEVGDEVGSNNATARIVRDLMQLCLLLFRHYPPYTKWLGSAFTALPGGAGIATHLVAAQQASTWPHRQRQLVAAYEAVAQLQNERRDIAPVDPRVRHYYERPYQVISGGRFVQALREMLSEKSVIGLPPVGCVDQWIDNTDALSDIAGLRRAVGALLQTRLGV